MFRRCGITRGLSLEGLPWFIGCIETALGCQRSQHFLNFRPDPHLHGSFLPILASRRTRGEVFMDRARRSMSGSSFQGSFVNIAASTMFGLPATLPRLSHWFARSWYFLEAPSEN